MILSKHIAPCEGVGCSIGRKYYLCFVRGRIQYLSLASWKDNSSGNVIEIASGSIVLL